jgi:hypothetical protein
MKAKVVLPDYRTTYVTLLCDITFAQLQEQMRTVIRVPIVQYSYLDCDEDDWIDVVDEDDWAMALESIDNSEDAPQKLLMLRIRKITKTKLELEPVHVTRYHYERVRRLVSADSFPYDNASKERVEHCCPPKKSFNDMFCEVLMKHRMGA